METFEELHQRLRRETGVGIGISCDIHQLVTWARAYRDNCGPVGTFGDAVAWAMRTQRLNHRAENMLNNASPDELVLILAESCWDAGDNMQSVVRFLNNRK